MTDRTIRDVLLEALTLKRLARAGWLRVGVTGPESVAAHSWGVAWLVLALCPPGLDRGRALALAVIHDLAEARTGDITPHDGVGPAEKRRREHAALADLLSPLPNAAALQELFSDYEDGASDEACFVKACDRLDMALQASRYAAEQGVDTAEFIESAVSALGETALARLVVGR